MSSCSVSAIPTLTRPSALSTGQLEAMRDGDTHYTSILGHAELREAIAARHRRLAGRLSMQTR